VAPAEAPPGADLLFLARGEVERLLDPDALLEALGGAFLALSAGQASAPPRTAARTASGLLGVMPAFVPGLGLETKLVSVFPANHRLGLPSHQALIALFDEESGRPLSVMDGTHITAARTAAASALSARLLARPDARVLAVLGAGVQGAAHLEALGRVRRLHEVRVASRSYEHAEALASRSSMARAVRSFEDAVRGADLVCCCTHSPEPVLRRDWLGPGTHVTSVGANVDGPELDSETVRGGRLFVESRGAFDVPPAGAFELVGLDAGTGTELGEVLSGRVAGRTSEEEVTVYKSTGHAVEDAAAARLVYERALAEHAGQSVRLEG
jgi:alanine dehydrogenase